MKIEEIDDVRKDYLNKEYEEFYDMDVEELHRELHSTIKIRDSLESSKKHFSSRVNETLKLVKARIKAVADLIDEREMEPKFPA